jgi:osmotically-inducible protein OsmY
MTDDPGADLGPGAGPGADPGPGADSGAEPHSDYADASVQRALAEDDGIAELGIDLESRAGTEVLTGQVESQERRAEIEARVRRMMPDRHLVNEIVVAGTTPPPGSEEL